VLCGVPGVAADFAGAMPVGGAGALPR
jgi:hypothetical protein